MCLGILRAYEVDPLVALRLRNAADYHLPTFGLHGTKLGHFWFEWIIKCDFLSGLTILKEERCLRILSDCGVDPGVALRLRNAADYRLPTFGPHDTKLGHSWYQWIIKSHLSCWFDNSEKGDESGQLERLRRWSRGCTPPQEFCRLLPSYFWTTWHQTRAFLISVNIEKWSFLLVWQFWKRRWVWAMWVGLGLILWLQSASGMLETTAFLLLGHMAPN